MTFVITKPQWDQLEHNGREFNVFLRVSDMAREWGISEGRIRYALKRGRLSRANITKRLSGPVRVSYREMVGVFGFPHAGKDKVPPGTRIKHKGCVGWVMRHRIRTAEHTLYDTRVCGHGLPTLSRDEFELDQPAVNVSDMQYHESRQTGDAWYTLYVPEHRRHYQAYDTMALRIKVENAGVLVFER